MQYRSAATTNIRANVGICIPGERDEAVPGKGLFFWGYVKETERELLYLREGFGVCGRGKCHWCITASDESFDGTLSCWIKTACSERVNRLPDCRILHFST